MKKLMLLFACLTIILSATAQVSINTDNSAPDPSAMLDVKSPSKGLLVPRVSLIAINLSEPVPTPAVGLMVFNLASAGPSPNNVVPGYYRWNGSRWLRIEAPQGVNIGDMQYWNGSQWITVPAGLPGQFLQMSSEYIPVWSGGTFAIVSTTSVTSITSTSANVSGFISSDGGSMITERGFCWSTNPSPTVNDNVIASGYGTGTFSSVIAGLAQNTSYYVRAYAKNSAGIEYGNTLSFSTQCLTYLPVSVIITPTGNPVCQGATVTFSASVTNGGTNPIFSWKVNNNVVIGATNMTYSFVPADGDMVACVATSNAGCVTGNPAISNVIAMGVTPVPTVSVTIAASPNPICDGSLLTLTASPVNGGTNPTYQWMVNGVATGVNNASHSYYPEDGDSVQCVLTSSQACAVVPVFSNLTIIEVNPLLSVGITISVSENPVCSSDSVTFTSVVFNSGTISEYQWKLNGNHITGATNATFSTVPTNNAIFSCRYTSNPLCALNGSSMSNEITIMTVLPPTTPLEGIHEAGQNQIVWKWNPVTGAEGYRWNTTADFSTATDVGLDTMKLETGLSCASTYERFVWAYDSCGTSPAKLLSQSTTSCGGGGGGSNCGSSVTANHQAGSVAPVSKTVTYTIVTNMPGEPSKCWISSNLGSSHPATAVNDSTEESAGWYWQFNRKQGYKHDGSIRTPNSSWIASIDENADWVMSNDPCYLELGSNWRLPSATEWLNVDATGNWTNWNGGWNSALALHAAGYLAFNDGTLLFRKTGGNYWSNGQNSTLHASYLSFTIGTSEMLNNHKSFGFTVRCLKPDCSSPLSPGQAAHTTTPSSITWNWNSVAGASGYKWNTINDYSTATDKGNQTVHAEQGLQCATSYIRYVWAYNTCGFSEAVVLTKSTDSCAGAFSCGQTLTINHVAGNVAPVNKNTAYGTVTGIPGEPTKCWITSNLGSDHQASAENDATEQSAGWYWQFNRKQGYKHDNGVRTPSTSWTSNTGNFDWVPANDPCGLELGVGWRLPTATEWINVDAAGNWSYSTDVWNSLLKIHKAGHLYGCNNGQLYFRGGDGRYSSSTQYNDNNSYKLEFNLSFSSITTTGDCGSKSDAFTIRCIKDNCPTSPTSPDQSSHAPSSNQIIWNWTSVSAATGYKWNTSNDYASATDMGTATSKTETGLTCNTPYTRYAWAYNECGASSPVTLTQSTLACSGGFTCGQSLTINHVAGNVVAISDQSRPVISE